MNWGGPRDTRRRPLWTRRSGASIRTHCFLPKRNDPQRRLRSICTPCIWTHSTTSVRRYMQSTVNSGKRPTQLQGLCVWELVVSVARAQYRIALAVRGYDDERIEAELPADPLGIARADGWDLAAERGVLALERWVWRRSWTSRCPRIRVGVTGSRG